MWRIITAIEHLNRKIQVIKEDEEIIGFKIDGREFYLDESGTVEVQIKDLEGFNISEIPKECGSNLLMATR